ncbi:hypothetical protein K7472_24335 [Streptomyces sp. PTM05]|uniref:Uncharacterized protein n=1 Tax=Streptantibioticus parmotrematis TaxID=2873249 RepID=A0ABS7QZ69_9ACTN|nr:hypothetical protein [Streptantibioticus parmotrematis]MBY8887944.1 hypothetical protein [Streptantibioticus parmotrematis]
MAPINQPQATPAMRQAQAQAAIRALTTRGRLTPEQRLELARWQRAWLAAWRDADYVTAA